MVVLKYDATPQTDGEEWDTSYFSTIQSCDETSYFSTIISLVKSGRESGKKGRAG